MSDGDDDICGYDTPNGPCQNPATNGDSCWIDKHGGDKGGHGRPGVISEADHDEILDAARNGLSKGGCARAAGTSRTTLNRYLEDNPDFRSAFARARRKGEQKLAEGGLTDPDVDTSMAKFLLSTSYDYVKTERRELTGEDGGPVETRDLSAEEKAQLDDAFDAEPET